MTGTIIFFVVLLSLFLTLYVYGREDVLDSIEHRREKLEMRKQYYMEIGKYSDEPKGVPINTKGWVKFNSRTRQWEPK